MRNRRKSNHCLIVFAAFTVLACKDIQAPRSSVSVPTRSSVNCYDATACEATGDTYVPQTHEEIVATFGDGLLYQFHSSDLPTFDPASYGLSDYLDFAIAPGCIQMADYGMFNGDARWEAPSGGMIMFPVLPPFTFVSYKNAKPYKGLYWSVYNTNRFVKGTDPNTGDIWEFAGEFTALCRTARRAPGGGQIGYIYVRDAVSTPRLYRRGGGGGGGESGDACEETEVIYDPDDPCSSGGGGTGGGGSGGGGGDNCHSEYVTIEVSTDGGNSWTTWFAGEAQVCG